MKNDMQDDPLSTARGIINGILISLFFWSIILLFMFLSSAAKANDDLLLQGQTVTHLSRPVSVAVTDQLPQNCDTRDAYACAVNAYGQGRCAVFIRPDKLEYLYHELQHCAGLTHTAGGD